MAFDSSVAPDPPRMAALITFACPHPNGHMHRKPGGFPYVFPILARKNMGAVVGRISLGKSSGRVCGVAPGGYVGCLTPLGDCSGKDSLAIGTAHQQSVASTLFSGFHTCS